MAVLAIINRKGGCGKTTLATHVAVSFARQLKRITLVDVDFQQSTVRWLKRRRAQVGSFEFSHSFTDTNSLQRLPVGVCNAVVDTPGNVHGYELAKLLLFADLVLIPVCDSVFDYDGSADCIAEMRQHPKVAKGRVKIAVVGFRIQPGSPGERRAREWARRQAVPYLGSIRSSSLYGQVASKGLTVFDLANGESGQDEMEDWTLMGPQLDELLASHVGNLELGKSRNRAQGSLDSGYSDSVFGSSNFGPLTRPHEQASIVSRSPGVRRPEAGHSWIGSVLRNLPGWSSRDRNQTLV